MQLFISWSGERSKLIAESLREWLPLLLQSVEPWFSQDDIAKGSRWLADLTGQLSSQVAAIVCITPENTGSQWMHFEAGALSRTLDSTMVCPLFVGLDPTDVQGPFAQFQGTRGTKEDIRRLVGTLNRGLDKSIPDANLDSLFEVLWPRLELKLTQAKEWAPTDTAPSRPAIELLTELLGTVRSLERSLSEPRSRESDIRDIEFVWQSLLLELRITRGKINNANQGIQKLDEVLSSSDADAQTRDNLMQARTKADFQRELLESHFEFVSNLYDKIRQIEITRA